MTVRDLISILIQVDENLVVRLETSESTEYDYVADLNAAFSDDKTLYLMEERNR